MSPPAPIDLARQLRLYVLTDRRLAGNRPDTEIVQSALAGGATAIQLRAKDEPARGQIERARRLAACCRTAGALFIVNDRLDVALAAGADGVHLGRDDLPLDEARRLAGPRLVIGISAETVEEARLAEAGGADYVGVGPVFATDTKADAGAPVGTGRIAAIRRALGIPIVGIGGIHAGNAAEVVRAGAAGVAVISAVVSAPDVRAATVRLANAVAAGLPAAPATATAPAAPAAPAQPGTGAGRPGEFELIDRLAARLPVTRRAVKGIGDDAAVLPGERGRPAWVFTADMLVEDVHFRRAFSEPADIGWKALAVNASDAAAMGARPCYALVSLAIPGHWVTHDLEALYDGLAEAAETWGIEVVGGDTTRSGRDLVVDVSLLGPRPGAPVLRSGARPGDLLVVTGRLGASRAGLALLAAGGMQAPAYARVDPQRAAEALAAYRRPRPPVAAGTALGRKELANAMMDISDGLAADLHHILNASGVGAVLDAARIPIAPAAESVAEALKADALTWALAGGEDYQLLIAVPPARKGPVLALLEESGTTGTVIGEITADPGAFLNGPDGRRRPLTRAGWDHFA